MSMMASQITSLMIVYSTIYAGANQRKHQSSTSLAFVRGIHQWLVNSPHKGPVIWKIFLFDGVILHYNTSQEICLLWCLVGFCFGLLSVNFTNSLQDFLMSLGQSCDCPNVNEANLEDMGKQLTQIHQEAHHEQNISEHNITMCMVYGIYFL